MPNAELLKTEFDRRFETSTKSIKYENPRLPLDIEVMGRGSGLEIPYEDLELLLSCARWEVPPPFVVGRSAWVVCKKPIVSTDSSHTEIHAFKLKGIGAMRDGVAHPPRDEQYFAGKDLVDDPDLALRHVLVHKGINADGSFRPVIDPPKPVGGMSHLRGAAEFYNAKLLLEKGVSAIRPVVHGRYNTLHWQRAPMEFVILASTLRDPARISNYFEPERDSMGKVTIMNPLLTSLLYSRFTISKPGSLRIPILRCINELINAEGKALRSFNEAGLCRFAGHTGNFAYDTESRIAIIHDLDSSVPIDSLAEGARGLAIIRDLESALFGTTNSLLFSDIYNMAGYEVMKKNNPYKAFLLGYFGNRVEESVINETADKILDKIFSLLRTMPPIHIQELYIPWFSEMNDIFSHDVMEMLLDIFSKSALAQQHPLPYGPGPIYREHVAKFQREAERAVQEEYIKRVGLDTGKRTIFDIIAHAQREAMRRNY